MKKIILTKSNTAADGSSSTYLMRKSMVRDYQELFQALLRLPDKKVQARVLDAINNTSKHSPEVEVVEICNKCKQKRLKVVDASTQTDKVMSNLSTNTTNSDDSRDTPPLTFSIALKNEQQETSCDDNNKKRKRRRKIQFPQVIKRSQALQQVQLNRPMLQKRKAHMLKAKESNSGNRDLTLFNNKRQRSDSTSSGTSISSKLYDDKLYQHLVESLNKPTLDDIKLVMADEFLKAKDVQDDGLWPIHSAIVENDSKYLKRQILVWKNMIHADLNELITADDEDCLQLAVKENTSPDIVNILLSNGLNPNSCDAQSNTIIHLAILNEVDLKVMHLLMEKIDLNLLSTQNDDGFTPLHLAVRQNNYLLAEEFLNVLDKRLLGNIYFSRSRIEESESIKPERRFLKYYESCCLRLKMETYMHKYSKQHLFLKRKLMDAVEIRSGKTALFYAIENKLEHFIYFLLAHFTDPRVESHSGQDATSFLNEFAKCLNLTLKIDEVMQNIVNLLEKL